MPNSSIFDAWHAQLKKDGIPASAASRAAESLCRILDHQLYIRDRAHGDLLARFEALKAEVSKMKYQGDAA